MSKILKPLHSSICKIISWHTEKIKAIFFSFEMLMHAFFETTWLNFIREKCKEECISFTNNIYIYIYTHDLISSKIDKFFLIFVHLQSTNKIYRRYGKTLYCETIILEETNFNNLRRKCQQILSVVTVFFPLHLIIVCESFMWTVH